MLERLVPKLRVNSVYDIDLEKLYAQGIRGIITDLDNTLVGAKVALATPELAAWLKTVEEKGIRVVIVSNNNADRVGGFSTPLSLPFVYSARKPSRRAFKQALDLLRLKPEQTVMIGDQMLTDVLGGNRMGLYTVLVAPISPADEGVMTRVNRKIERIALVRLRKRGLWHEEEQK
ncbi:MULTISPECIES: YqeG family HAD IIIA-type phosphatase [unclassified Paenibacillus]|uniref:YqeG family HAD IIIA-type phosphatase n=1 Tax=unclassified Paenibacillus TaxID=185978 RepID=UPI002F42CCE7